MQYWGMTLRTVQLANWQTMGSFCPHGLTILRNLFCYTVNLSVLKVYLTAEILRETPAILIETTVPLVSPLVLFPPR